jgi:biotin synthase
LSNTRQEPHGATTADPQQPAACPAPHEITQRWLEGWLRETDAARLDQLYAAADTARGQYVGDAVHLRGLCEISNYCVRQCGYCGLRFENKDVHRYRMTQEEILACAHEAVQYGYGTLVLQSGEDYGITREWMVGVVSRIKAETPLAVTLSLGERPYDDLAAWREAGADRYLLRFETADEKLYELIHPSLPNRPSDRFAILGQLRFLGYEVGSGIMIGIPGQSYLSVARDILAFRELDLDMIGVGPYLPHPATPLGSGVWGQPLPPEEQVPNTEKMTYKVIALARLTCPEANIPSTTALATLNTAQGRELGLQRGANIVMPNLTPPHYRVDYEIYPGKACITETGSTCHICMHGRIESIGRSVGEGQGARTRGQ